MTEEVYRLSDRYIDNKVCLVFFVCVFFKRSVLVSGCKMADRTSPDLTEGCA